MPGADRGDVDVDRLAILLPGWTIDWSPRTGSTNADLLERARTGVAGPVLAVTEEQTAGRGRSERTWSSPRGAGLTFSMLLRPSAPLVRWGWLPLLAGVALCQTVRGAGVGASLKWPNDLLAPDGRKLAGILAQTAGGSAVIGIGLNVSTTEAELPVATASSLLLAGSADVDRTELLASVCTAVLGRLRAFDAAGGDARARGLADDYASACSTLGAQVRAELLAGASSGGGAALHGSAVRIAEDGALVVRADDGTEHAVHAGDVQHLRPA